MCMLCVIPPMTIPTREKLENSALNNPHGFGFAIVIKKENRIHSERTMDADTSINRFLAMRERYPDDYAMWHARLATHGSTTIDNCHPFKVGSDKLTYLAHNGILPIIETVGDDRSDTRIFAEDLLPRIGGVCALDNEQVLNLIEDFTSGSKVAILTLHPEAEQQAYIIHKSKGNTDVTGVWWSNDSCYLTPKVYSGYDYMGTGRTYTYNNYAEGRNNYLDEPLYCIMCDLPVSQKDVDDKDECPNCGACFECNESYIACECPRTKARRSFTRKPTVLGGSDAWWND